MIILCFITSQMKKDDYSAEIINFEDQEHHRRYKELVSMGEITVIDKIESQLLELLLCRNPDQSNQEIENSLLYKEMLDSVDTYSNWVYYSWDRVLIRVLKEAEFIEVRTNRNRNKITTAEQNTLSSKTIGIAGLSVGRSVAITLASERICGNIKLADFDEIELSNLNRIKTSLKDLGVNKAVSTAREIAYIDPYIRINCFKNGLTEENIEDFLSVPKLDLFIEECDDLNIKLKSRVKARESRIPVLMEASDRCLVDIERYDLDANLPILHGIVDDEDLKRVGSLKTFPEKLALMSKIVDVNKISEGMKKSLPEIGRSLRTWPQLASDVTYGGGVLAMISRELLLGKHIKSGRYYLDPGRKIFENN